MKKNSKPLLELVKQNLPEREDSFSPTQVLENQGVMTAGLRLGCKSLKINELRHVKFLFWKNAASLASRKNSKKHLAITPLPVHSFPVT